MTPSLPPVPLSVLDLSPVGEGSTSGEALRSTIELAQAVEALGFTRFWVAEHHNMPGIASSAPAVLIAAIAGATSRIRVGSGGVMLPNHSPLVVAEQFGTLEALHPGRIDLGIGRAPGTDMRTAHALRRGVGEDPDDLPRLLAELVAYFRGGPREGLYAGVAATPGDEPPVWLLGSSTYSARLAGALGLPFAFAHHFSSGDTVSALQLYRSSFQPSQALERPYVMLPVQVVCAEDDATARRLAAPASLAFLRLRQGRPGRLPTPEAAESYPWNAFELDFANERLARQAVGSPETVAQRLADLLAATGADELMLTAMVHDPADRLRSMELVRGMVPQAVLPRGLGTRVLA